MKDKIHAKNKALMFKGELLDDDRTLKDYGIEEGSTLDLVGKQN